MKQIKYSIARARKYFRTITAGLLALALLSFAMSCGDSGDKKEAGATRATGNAIYTTYQQIFCLNMLSNIAAMYNGKSAEQIKDSTTYAIKTVLASQAAVNYIGQWKCVWGPAVITNQLSDHLKHVASNTMYVARNASDTNLYVIAIAGTNFASVSDWLYEDGDVFLIRPWDSVVANINDTMTFNPILDYKYLHMPFISRATFRGLHNLLVKLKDPTSGQTISSFLQNLAATAKDTVKIWTTGHSLGGALAPTLALYLNDTKSTWANTNQGYIVLNCLAVAGATPGNGDFSAYYASKLGSTTTRIWNMHDVVPHCVNDTMFQQIDTIYRSVGLVTPDTSVINTMARAMSVRVGLINLRYNYQQLFPSADTVYVSQFYGQSNMIDPSDTMNPSTSFLGQLLCQHVPAYPHFFGVDSFQYVVKNTLGYKYPYFSGGFNPAPILGKYVDSPTSPLNAPKPVSAAKAKK